MLSKYN